jgi:hypothetical protein
VVAEGIKIEFKKATTPVGRNAVHGCGFAETNLKF